MSLAQELMNMRARRVKKLSLANRGLTEIPDDIGYLADTLEELDLSNNKLTVLPKAIGWLKKLKVLRLNHNRLTAASFPSTTKVEVTLPTLIKNISVLQPDGITYKYYELEKGEGLKGLTSLEKLYLDNNQLADLPPDLTFVTTLKTLSASNNQMTALTGGAVLVNMERLYLSYNKFTAIPAGVALMVKLVTLAMNHNLITSVISLAPLIKLQQLNLSNNQIPGALPAWIASLAEIRQINFDNNLLTSLPDGIITSLQNIEVIRVNNNPIVNPVSDIGQDYRNNDILETLAYRDRHISPTRKP